MIFLLCILFFLSIFTIGQAVPSDDNKLTPPVKGVKYSKYFTTNEDPEFIRQVSIAIQQQRAATRGTPWYIRVNITDQMLMIFSKK